MKTTFIYRLDASTICWLLFVLMMLMVFIGLKLRSKYKLSNGLGPLEGSMFGLLALILAFTFGMSGSRFDARRTIVVQEANDIGTAILRADLYPDSTKLAFKKDFSGYLESRIAFYEAKLDEKTIRQAALQEKKFGKLLWERAAANSRNPALFVASNSMIPALNAIFDTSTSRDAALNAKVPDPIIWLLIILSICCSFFAGLEVPLDKKVNWLTIFGFGLFSIMVIYVILDLDRPRSGLITTDRNQQYIYALRDLLK
ncbi:MAG: hypothetical protein RLZZ28_872 [Bacteroidota bacterium]|jgi:hypothetical protein